MNISFTFIDVFADVSMNSKLLSSAYDWASWQYKVITTRCQRALPECIWAGSTSGALTWKSTALLLARSALLPDRAMTILGLACLCSSLTQFLARANDSCEQGTARFVARTERLLTKVTAGYLVCDVVDHDGRLRSSVIHRRQTVVALLTCCVPDFKLHRRVV